MVLPQWLLYTAAISVVLYSLSLTYWAYRLLAHEHPLDAPGNLPWMSWLILVFALAGIEMPGIATFVILVLSFAAWILHPYAGYGCATLAVIAAMLYLYANHCDLQQSRAEREQYRQQYK